MQWRIQGKPPPPYCYPKLGQLGTDPPPPPPPPPHFRVWMTGPLPYLKVWICDCDVKAISNPFPLLCLCAKVTKKPHRLVCHCLAKQLHCAVN